MTDNNYPNPDTINPSPNSCSITYVRPTIQNPNIIVGEFTYFADRDFERHVTHHYGSEKLIIGKFCQIAAGVSFVMNGANHHMTCVSTYPFYIMDGWNDTPPDIPTRGDTVIGNDVWIGQNVTVLPGVHIGDGAIIGLNSTVGSDIEPYTVYAGNPAKFIRRRFDDELTGLLLRLRWWDRDIDGIKALIPLLTCDDIGKVKRELKAILL